LLHVKIADIGCEFASCILLYWEKNNFSSINDTEIHITLVFQETSRVQSGIIKEVVCHHELSRRDVMPESNNESFRVYHALQPRNFDYRSARPSRWPS
jgi:hypothetical protein